MRTLDQDTARALTEAGYMPLSIYIEVFGHEGHNDATLVPEGCDDPHDAVDVTPKPISTPA